MVAILKKCTLFLCFVGRREKKKDNSLKIELNVLRMFLFHDFLSDFAAEVGIGGFFVLSAVVDFDVVDFGVITALDLRKITNRYNGVWWFVKRTKNR